MGCNCGGSAPRQAANSEVRAATRDERQQTQPPLRRIGGPGHPDYYAKVRQGTGEKTG